MTIHNFTGNTFGAPTNTKFTRLYNNQFFDYLSEQLPKDHKEMLKWCEVVYSSSPALVNGIKKLISYPITDLQYLSKSENQREETKDLLTKSLNIESHLIQLGMDYYVYGNAFRGIYYPFSRFLVCKHCSTRVAVKHADYEVKKGKFIINKCPSCSRKGIASLKDEYTFDPKNIRLVNWDPKSMDMLSNPVTGDTAYYYTLPPVLRQGLANGEPVMAATLPEVFLSAFAQNKKIQFNDNFYHVKTPSIAGFASGWGISPLAPTLKLFLYSGILRKSVEAISLEQITPQRILYPQGTSSDPTLVSSMGQWKEQMQKAIERWRVDPNYIMMAPYPTGVANVGSKGRGLMPTEEIKQVDQDMLLALDVPLEFVYGGMKMDTGSVALRVLENQLRPYVSQITRYVNWIIDNINAKYEKNFCHVKFGDFTLADDLMKRQLLIQMAGQGASISTVQESLGLDPDQEADRQYEDTLRAYQQQKKLETATAKIEENITARAEQRQQADQEGTLPQYDQQKLVAAAQLKAQEILSVPYEERRSLLARLSNEDYVMYALVSAQMDSMRKTMEEEQQQGGF
jgi:hypothetical protein